MRKKIGQRPSAGLLSWLLLPVLLLSLPGGVSGAPAAVDRDPAGFPSIHARKHRAHAGFIPRPLASEPAFASLAPGTLSVPAVNRQVMGFYPYWITGTANLQWDLLTILAWFSADASAKPNREGASMH